MEKSILKYSSLVIIVLLLSVMGSYLIRARFQSGITPSTLEMTPGDGLKTGKIHLTQTDTNKGVKYILDAEEYKTSKDMQHMSLKNFQFSVEPENGVCFKIEGKLGDYERQSNVIHLRGDLYGSTDDGYQFMTQHLMLDQKEGYLRTDEPVQIIGPFFSVKGKGLFLDLNKKILRILSEVTTIIDGEAVAL